MKFIDEQAVMLVARMEKDRIKKIEKPLDESNQIGILLSNVLILKKRGYGLKEIIDTHIEIESKPEISIVILDLSINEMNAIALHSILIKQIKEILSNKTIVFKFNEDYYEMI